MKRRSRRPPSLGGQIMGLSDVRFYLDARETFLQMNRYGPVINDFRPTGAAGRFVVVRDGDKVWLEDRRQDPNDFPEITESAFARLVREYERAFQNRRQFALAIQMTHAPPPYCGEYERIMKAPLVFGAARNAILVEGSWLDAPIPTANSYVFGIFSAHAEALLKELAQLRTIRGRIESLLIPILHTGDVGMEEIARRMGMSKSSLYRRLREEGANFDEVLDELRRRMADHYLAAARTTVAEVAYLVGFSDPGAFSKAYRRWTGRKPSDARSSY